MDVVEKWGQVLIPDRESKRRHNTFPSVSSDKMIPEIVFQETIRRGQSLKSVAIFDIQRGAKELFRAFIQEADTDSPLATPVFDFHGTTPLLMYAAHQNSPSFVDVGDSSSASESQGSKSSLV